MESLINKLSSYNIFNYLFPGVVFVVIVEYLTMFSLIQENILLGLFLYYFIGLAISRIGSIVVEPILKHTKLLHTAHYSDYIKASKIDDKIDLLSENNNMYRTLCSSFLLLILIRIFELIVNVFPVLSNWVAETLVMSLFVLFLLSFKKQTQYITKRIELCLRKDDLHE